MKNIVLFKNIRDLPLIRITFMLITVTLAIFWIQMESDSWWSMRYGQELVHGVDIWHEHWTWTRQGVKTQNHEWLWEFILYAGYKIGFNTLTIPIILNSLCITGPFLILMSTKSNKYDIEDSENMERKYFLNLTPMTVLIYFVLLITILYYYNTIRAFQVTFLLTFCSFYFIKQRKNIYYMIPLMLLWCNLHAGFVMGFLLMGTSLIASIISLIQWRRFKNNDKINEEKIYIKQIIITLISSFAISLCNPMGWGIWQYVISNGNKNQQLISEWLPLYHFPSFFTIMVIFMLITFGAILEKRLWLGYKEIYSIIVLSILCVMSILYIRNNNLFLILASPLILSPYNQKINPSIRIIFGQFINIFCKIFIPIISIFLLILPISKSYNVDHPISKKVVALYNSCGNHSWNGYTEGGLLEWFDKDHLTYQDSRYDYFSNEMYKAILFKKTINWENFTRDMDIKCAVVNIHDKNFKIISQSKNWKTVEVVEDYHKLVVK